MASTSELTRRTGGIFLSLLVAGIMLGVFTTLLLTPKNLGTSATPVNIAHLVRMGFIQASLSTALSLLCGIAIAWSLNRLRFPGRSFLISLLATAIVAPGLVVALGLINVWGRTGWANQFLDQFSLALPGSIFGLHGIVLAHTVLNGAFAAHLLLARLQTIPAQKLKTGQSLSLTPFQRFAVTDWPAIASSLPGLASIIFLLSFTSFPIVLLLGGGPANQTLEVAIYAAVRFSFDLNTAISLSIVQLLICTAIILPALISTPALATAGNTAQINWREKPIIRYIQIGIILLMLIGFALPLSAVLIKGFGAGLVTTFSRPSFWQATLTSMTLGITSAALTILIAIRIAMARTAFGSPLARTLLGLPLFAYLVMPSLVLALGFFLALRYFNIATASAAPLVLVIANILLALPFVFATLAPSLAAIDKRYAKLTRALDMSGFARWRFVEWPLLGRELGLAAALAFCFSLGDLGVISLFGTSEFTTLPWAMFRAMGAYRTNEAATIAALMLMLCLMIFWVLPSLFHWRATRVKN